MRKTVILTMVVSVLVAGCGRGGGERSGTINVFAAASLTGAFERLGAAFEGTHPNADLAFNFAGSSQLVAQIAEGAPADVFASADEANMRAVVEAELPATTPVIFARNRLAIAVEPGNPEGITGLADLADPDLTVVLCAEQAPCGKYADEALSRAGVQVTPASRGESVQATLSLVELGEADAAIVYATDVAAGDGVEGVGIPDDQNVLATLPIANLAESGNRELAAAFVDFVTSADGLAVLTDDFGFLAP